MSSTPSPHHQRTPLQIFEHFSLEMTGRDVDGLRAARDTIPPGTKVNITFLGTEDLQTRVRAAGAVRGLGLVPVPHISARRIGSKARLEEFLSRLRDVGASERVLVVGGDPATPAGPYADSHDLIRTGLLPAHGVREVSIAGYPEGHPAIDARSLWRSLDDKLRSLHEQGLASTIVTQFAFDPAPVLSWIDAVRARGVTSTIRVGTPGPASMKRLLGYATRFGVGANTMILKKYGLSLTNLLGTAGPERFVEELSARIAGEPGAGEIFLHFYTFGGLSATTEWVRARLPVRGDG